jgi:hypothetical protein
VNKALVARRARAVPGTCVMTAFGHETDMPKRHGNVPLFGDERPRAEADRGPSFDPDRTPIP